MGPERKGLFVVLEGSDGSGKNTQFNLLTARLRAVGYDVATYDFPRYDQGSSHFVRQYLKGEYGPAADISPYTASLFYALDRYETAKDIITDLSDGKIVLANRYVGSNMAHQGSKFTNPVEQRGFFVWNDNLEYELLKLPRPDTNIFLRVPAVVSNELIKRRAAKSGVKLDQHEDNLDHLKKAVATYDLLCQLFPKDFKAIECVKDDDLLSIPQISDLIWKYLKPMLPADKPKAGHKSVVTLGEAEPAAPKVSNNAAPDRLTVPFKSSSLLLRLEIEKAYPGSTVPSLSFWEDGGYDFYTPRGLKNDQAAVYKSAVRRISEHHAKIREALENYYKKQANPPKLDLRSLSYLVRPLTPLAAITPFEVVLEKTEVRPLALRLLESDLEEVQWAAKQLYLMAKQVWPVDFASPIESPDQLPTAGSAIVRLTAGALSLSDPDQPVRLLEAAPRQEFDLIAESIYPYSSLPLDDIAAEVAEWPYQQKYDGLRQAAAQPSVLREVRYKADIIADQISLSDLARAAKLQSVQSQTPSPRYGFEVPQIIEDANLDGLYNSCFDASLNLYSTLQAAGREDSAVYGVLLGHKVRWQLNLTAADLLTAYRDDPAAANSLIKKMVEAAAEDHPLLWDVLTGNSKAATATSHGNKVKPYHQRRKNRPNPKKS